MAKVILIGIDGMDYDMVIKHLDDLPQMARLHQRGTGSLLHSVFPPDSIPAWITIYTGIGPEEHCIIRSIDYLNKNYKDFQINTGVFRGKTFWDIAGNYGKKVCIVNPFMAYPVWPVRGTMISGPVFITGESLCYPQTIEEKYGLPEVLGGIVDFPTKKTLNDFVKKCESDTRILAEYAMKIFRGEEWDLFFISFLTLDRVQHFLWRYTDKEDPTYPGANKYQHVIKLFYKLFDEIIGTFLSAMREEDYLFVISDHGHGMRCTQYLNLNEYLRQLGYLKASSGKVACLSNKFWIEKAKHLVLQTLFTLGLEDLTYHISRFVPNREKLKKSRFVINSSASQAQLSDFAGAGPYGGLEINKGIKSSKNYENFRQQIIEDIWELDCTYGKRLFKWIKKDNEMFGEGSNNGCYPDIIFELKAPYGANWGLFIPIISRNPFHKKISGGHNSSGIIFSNAPFLRDKRTYRVHDIRSIVLEGLGISEY